MTAVTEALETGFTTIAGNVTSILGTMLPIALGVLGIVVAIRFAIRWFRSIVG